ncbi:kinesin-like protein KIN-12D [Humulus lupulus]|uniref:kinesin-like protein KIN-12D n=1 Tax=Humulus lupulus TaxID=3486 RepID=UPI002B415EBE|nr:kinesin-like protein KIN-12D [Humulus lupulus]
MLRDFKFLRRNTGKNDEPENIPVNRNDLSAIRISSDSSRAPLNPIQEPTSYTKQEQEAGGGRSKVDKTPSKVKTRVADPALPLRTPDKYGAGFSARQRFGWAAQKNELGATTGDLHDLQVRGAGISNGGFANMTPRTTTRTVGRAGSNFSETNSTQSTPTKSVSKPPGSSLRSKVDGVGGARTGNFAALYKGTPIPSGSCTVVNTVEVPHFNLKEDPSFWMEHNVQVVIRVRPLNSMERSTNGYNRSLKQESFNTISWIGHPETRFTFDHVACETVDQEMLFRMACLPMVENCLSGYNSCMFAYGQTGSGKTYTMLGDIENLEVKPSPHRGMTPRIFEFLFARIQAEEESRRDEKLTYNCKCSFLEIYNEQITDLLDPSCTNLLLREDVKKGVYVENLSEFEVGTVSDIVNLLIQGSSNRKVAATNMNRESSRSHSVFTCVIESRWEKDSTTNLRFARLNLVDLAGSERQKTSGAEGERLKEAANINKSLSTLGHVIMVLVDVAQGKPRHIPYRDSRLTFLLQDSLGGNSKTMIIANVSPSICSAAETLNTLKFAQRAKMIQNNAVVNEDSSGDVTTLQHQIQLLKEELFILKRQNVSRSLSFGLPTADDTRQEQESGFPGHVCDMDVEDDDLLKTESKGTVRMSTKQLKCLETTLAGALRREQMAETCIKQLEAEIEQLNRLARQREEDTRCTKMMLRFREDKIRREGALVNGSIPAESYLVEENRALYEEIQLLKAKLDKNPEVTRFALENIRLLDQLRRFQEFYEEGEREILLSEVSKLRDQLLQFLDGNSVQHSHPNLITEPEEAIYMNKKNDSFIQELEKTLTELEECRCNLKACLDENAKLSRELEDAQSMLINVKSKPADQIDSVKTTEDSQDLGPFDLNNAVQIEEMEAKHESILTKNAEEIVNLQLELDIIKIILKEEKWSAENLEERVICLNNELERAKEDLFLTSKHHEDTKTELMEAKSVIKAMESQQILSINEMEDLRNSNSRYMQLLSKYEVEIMALQEQLALKELKDVSPTNCSENDSSLLQEKVMRMQCSLEKAKRLNTWYQNDREFHVSNDEEMDQVRSQVEAETAEVIVCMQEELAILQQQVQDSHLKEVEMKRNLMLSESELKEVNEKVNLLIKDNESLSAKLEEKDIELKSLSEEWSLLTSEIEAVLSDGCELLIDASDQLEHISSSFPQKWIWISEHVGRMVRTISEKELLIEELRRCLEDANNKQSDVESMLKSLRGAAMVITEAHQSEYSEKEKDILALTSQLSLKASTINKLENRLKLQEDELKKASVCATVAFVIVNRLEEVNHHNLDELKHKNIQLSKSEETNMRKDALFCEQAVVVEEADKQIMCLRADLVSLKEISSDLKQKLSEEQKRTYAMTEKLKDVEENNILVAKEKLAELKYGVSSLKSCMGTHVEQYKSLERDSPQEDRTSFDGEGAGQIATEIYQDDDVDSEIVEDSGTDISKSSLDVEKKVCFHSCDQDKFKSFPCEDKCDRDTTIILLRREMESALQSLQEVQVEMEKLRRENKDILKSEQKSRESMKCFANQVQNLQATLSDFEVQSKLKMEALNQRLEASEQNVVEACSHLYETRELLELEVNDAKLVAAHKTAEVACILSKFEEAQDTMKEADIMINGLMIANETMKLEVKKLHKINGRLINDKDILANEVQSLQYINIFKSQQCEHLMSDLSETNALVVELQDMVVEVQAAFKENYMLLASDFRTVKSVLSDTSKLVRTWLEEIWSEIIGKDCAVSVLHLCHMGILLETVTGLNAENGLLQHGMCESNAVIADLKEHNGKSIKELEMCRMIKGKLLCDIMNGFDRISKMEEENQELSAKLATFDKKISELQLQEELMLQRSNYIGSQLAMLMTELDLSNKNLAASLLDQEKLLQDKEEVFKSQSESFMMEWSVKEFESLILASELDEMALRKADTEREHSQCCTILENLEREIFLFKVDTELKDQLLTDKEVEVACQFSVLEQQKQKMQEELLMLNSSSRELKNDFRKKEAELTRMTSFEKENELLKIEIENLNAENSLVLHNLEEKNSDVESYLGRADVFEKENHRLRNNILFLETRIANLEMDFKLKTDELHELQQSHYSMTKELCFNSEDLQAYTSSINTLKEENVLLREELVSSKRSKHELLTMGSSDIEKCVDLMDSRINFLKEGGFVNVDKMLKEICETAEKTNEFMEQIECLKGLAKELESENMSLQTELLRKDDVLKGLLFDLSLLQESASNTKDQKDEIEEVMASLEALEDELLVKSIELDEAMAAKQMLEAQLHEKTDRIATLELSISKDCESREVLRSENLELKAQLEDALTAKSSVEEDLTETRKVNESLEMELMEMGNAIDRLNDSIESLRSNLDELESERDQLRLEMLGLKNKLEAEQARAEEQEAIAKEAQEIAESKNIYVDEKEAEVKLLERSVEELEYTVNVLENKVDIVKGEAERQRLQREDLELELHAVKQQTQNVENADADMRRFLDEKEKSLQEALTQIQILERDIVEKDSEIAQFKVHISELNLHAEAQASEYKQKFKALEAMAEQVRPEGSFLHALTSSPKKTEKFAAKPRGSGSPFKCIGLGMVQQIKSERDEDLTAARLRIEELESLVASRQKEIFTLNTKLAAAESMTHDVIRDLLGVKLDMTTYVSLLDNQQVQKITEKTRFHDLDSQDMDQEVVKLKKQLTEFIKERQGWLEEIDRKQAEVVAAQVALEKLRQRDQLLKAENEMLKMENVNHKKKVMELEGEINKLSGQQNLHQRIHHHTKIKEENNTLKTHNADLSTKLRRTEVILSRVKEELACFRASNGRSPYIDFDEEKRLSAKLKETEEEKVQLAQKLLALCTSILKAAGITKPVNDINPSLAEEVLEQLKNKITSMDREVQDLKYKSKITSERARLCELMPHSSPINSRADEKRQTPKKVSQSPYFSDMDR